MEERLSLFRMDVRLSSTPITGGLRYLFFIGLADFVITMVSARRNFVHRPFVYSGFGLVDHCGLATVNVSTENTF